MQLLSKQVKDYNIFRKLKSKKGGGGGVEREGGRGEKRENPFLMFSGNR